LANNDIWSITLGAPCHLSYTTLADCACTTPQSGQGCDYSQLGYPTLKSE